jgi:hypothetical protein
LHLNDKPNQPLQEFMQHLQPAVFESLAANRFYMARSGIIPPQSGSRV